MDLTKIKISDFNYSLPDNKIAKYPLKKRDNSKLIIYKNNEISEDKFNKITSYLPENSLLVMNNTKVIHARLIFKKITGARIEIFCLNPHFPNEYSQAFEAKKFCQWECIVGNSKKWKEGELILGFMHQSNNYKLIAKKKEKLANNNLIEFEWNADISFGEVLELIGEIPIPPYLNRESEEIDKKTYQTIYSKQEGSVAAPTAGLHFTKDVFSKFSEKNISISEVTLHVGAGTFKPVKTEKISEHEMHYERFVITKRTIEDLKNNIGKIISVGTTTLRTLESVYWMGVKLLLGKEKFNKITQWEVYDLPKISVEKSLDSILNYMNINNTHYIISDTQIIIVPGYNFKIVNQLITNFHQPKSTLLLLVSAFIGENWRNLYNYALNNDFRFLSYGDSSILFRDMNDKI